MLHSKECQVQHWKQHKSDCKFKEKRHKLWKVDQARVNLSPDSNVHETKEGPVPSV